MDTFEGARMVTSAMLGMDGETILVGNRVYFILPPTIKRLAGCGHYLAGLGSAETIGEYFSRLEDIEAATKALSWLISGDESKADELGEGTLEEVVKGLETGLSLIGTENFLKLSVLSKNVSGLIAKPSR